MATSFSVTHVEETDTTQDDARQAYGPGPALVIAAHQRRGRGRRGTWESAQSSLAASLAFRPQWPTELRPTLTLLAGISAASTIEQELRVPRLGLKWPNDVVNEHGKVAGLLLESRDEMVVAGLGVNFQWVGPPPAGGASLLDRPATSEERSRVAIAWARDVLRRSARGPGYWGHDEYVERCVTIGADVRWEPNGAGRVESVSAAGELVVATNSGLQRLRSADVWEVRSQ